jgi:hypothetical protein
VQTIARFTEPWEAQMFCGRLWSEDIPAFVAFEFHVGNNWPVGLGLGGALVQVPDGAAEDARAVWQRCRAGAFRVELEDIFGDFGRIACPHCGSTRYRKHRRLLATAAAVVVVFVLGIAMPPIVWLYRCRVCGTQWKTD